MKSTHIARYVLVVLVSLLTLMVSTIPVGAQTTPITSYTFTVTTTADTHDARPGDGKCADKTGHCSLRAAIEEADALPNGSSITITVPAGTYSLTLGTLQLTANTITIHGASRKTTIIKGNHTFEIMSISYNVFAHLSQLTIEGGSGPNMGSGGGIFNFGTLIVSHSTLSGNTAYNGGGISNLAGSATVALTGTIVANSPKGSNCSGPITEGAGYNVDSGTSCGFSLGTDLNNTNPKLGPLQNNGGPTQTMALLQGSKAIDWVALTSCPATDQRGYSRPDKNESTCDIGAYESAY